jgi:hypothetical protein
MRLIYTPLVIAVCAAALSACSGGVVPPPAPPVAVPTPIPLSNVYVGAASGVATVEYGPTGTSPIGTLSNTGAAAEVATDTSGDVYVAFSGSFVEEHAATTHRLVRKITGFHQVNDLALDAKNNLYVVDGYASAVSTVPAVASNLSEVSPGSSSPSRVLLSIPYESGPGVLSSVAVDSKGNVYAGTDAGNIYVFAPGATAPARTIPETPTSVVSMAFDEANSLYAFCSYGPAIGEAFIDKIALGGSKPIQTFGSVGLPNSPQSLALDSSNNLYELNDPIEVNPSPPTFSLATVSEYAPGATLSIFGIAPLNSPIAIALDPRRNLYVLDVDATGSGEHLTEYAPGATAPLRTMPASGRSIGISFN